MIPFFHDPSSSTQVLRLLRSRSRSTRPRSAKVSHPSLWNDLPQSALPRVRSIFPMFEAKAIHLLQRSIKKDQTQWKLLLSAAPHVERYLNLVANGMSTALADVATRLINKRLMPSYTTTGGFIEQFRKWIPLEVQHFLVQVQPLGPTTNYLETIQKEHDLYRKQLKKRIRRGLAMQTTHTSHAQKCIDNA